ncbi:MAG: pyridoxamine 5'-phosphate oxidase family protein [Verrucomicrobiota bacterium]
MPTATPDKIHGILEDFSTAMLITSGDSSPFHARPMEIAWLDPDCRVWFYTSLSSPKVEEIKQDQHVLLTFQKDHSKYLTLAGTADIVRDRTRIEALWKESYRSWFPDGITDPDLVLVRVVPQSAEFWDNSGTQGIRYLYEAAKARLKGTTPHIEEGEVHGVVSMA